MRDNELNQLSVTELCDVAGIDRSTFYANYEDVSALANEYAAKIEKHLEEQPHKENDFSWIFDYIKEHPDLFKIYFKLGVSRVSSDYKTTFFRTGAYSVAKMWFEDGCIEPAEQMGTIVKREYEKIYK